MYKISGEVIKFTENTTQSEREELTAREESLSENPWRDFQGYALLPLLFVISMIPLSHILRKCTNDYKLYKL